MGNINLSSGNKCPVCGQTNVDINISGGNDPLYYYCCPNCGCFFAPSDSSIRFGKLKFPFNLNHLKEYLFYHPQGDMRPVICEKSCYDKYITDEYKEVFSITPEMVENWYPRSFAEKVDLILQKLDDLAEYDGAYIPTESFIEKLTCNMVVFCSSDIIPGSLA